MTENLFKKIGGPKIDNIVDYLIEYLKTQNHGTMSSNVQICIGCDSQTKRKNINYAITIVMYNDFKQSEYYENLTKAQKLKYNKAYFEKEITSNIFISKYFQERIYVNGIRYRSIITNYKLKKHQENEDENED